MISLDIWQAILITVVGIAGGFFNVVAGGGSLLTVPSLLFLDCSGPVANGTNRIAILSQNVTAAYTFFRNGYSNLRLSLTLAAATIPGAILGAYVGTRLDGKWFDYTVAAVMLAVMASMAVPAKSSTVLNSSDTPKKISPRRLLAGHIAMVFVGLWGGFIQIGVGFIVMPVTHKILGLDLVSANMNKTFVIAVYTIAALLVFANNVELEWALGVFLAFGMALGGMIGAKASVNFGELFIKRILFMALSLMILKLIFL